MIDIFLNEVFGVTVKKDPLSIWYYWRKKLKEKITAEIEKKN